MGIPSLLTLPSLLYGIPSLLYASLVSLSAMPCPVVLVCYASRAYLVPYILTYTCMHIYAYMPYSLYSLLYLFIVSYALSSSYAYLWSTTLRSMQ